MESLPESLKFFANRIARAADSENAAEVVRLLRLSGFFGGADLNEAFSSLLPPISPQNDVGIWERKIVNGKASFVRRIDKMPEWSYWADVARIDAKGEKTRVLLLGESVARGYLYDPVFTPAMALQTMLEARFGQGQIEVIDLARTNLGFPIAEVGVAALQLEPDAAVIFAGNNWYIGEALPSEVTEIDAAILQQGMAGAKQAIETQITRHSRRVVRTLSEAYESRGIPLVWIIPEFNLRDWRDPVANAPYLSNGRNAEWLNLMEEAVTALRASDLELAMRLAERMVEIDEGVCVTGFQILAECSRRLNDLERERKYLALARDSGSWDLSSTTVPRSYSVTQQALRDETSQFKGQVIDLPVLFKEYLDGGIPDRRLFLDYCHLTTEGIQVTMSAAASCLLRALKGIDSPWFALKDDGAAPSPETEAEASFLAAITNGHCGQPYDVVHHFCARALRYSPHIAQLMLYYLELQTRSSVPMRMSEVEGEILKVGSPLMRGLLRLNKKRLDSLFLVALVNALKAVGIEARERLEQFWREEHSVRNRPIDLLDYYYCSAADQPQELVWQNRPTDKKFCPEADYYRAYWPESRFVFIGEAGCAIQLCLTCRLPKPTPRETSIKVALNGKPQVETIISSEWSTWDIHIPGEAVHVGPNEIVVRWPMPEFESNTALEKARQSLVERKFADFYPVFGEIHSFTAADGQQVTSSIAVAEAESSLVEVA